jgi:hypothetical protein
LPPIADPAAWQHFVDNMNITTGPVDQLGRDECDVDELLEDNIIASVALDLFKTYSLPYSWSCNLHQAFFSNDYQKRISITRELPDSLLGGAVGRKESVDTLKVSKIVF